MRYAYSPSCHGSRDRRPKRSRHRRATPELARGSGSGGSGRVSRPTPPHDLVDDGEIGATGPVVHRADPDRPLARTIPTYRPIPLSASGTEPPRWKPGQDRSTRSTWASSVSVRCHVPSVATTCSRVIPASCSRGAFGGRDATDVSSHAGSSSGPPPAYPTSCGLPPTTIGPWAGRTILRRPSSRGRRGDPNRRPC